VTEHRSSVPPDAPARRAAAQRTTGALRGAPRTRHRLGSGLASAPAGRAGPGRADQSTTDQSRAGQGRPGHNRLGQRPARARRAGARRGRARVARRPGRAEEGEGGDVVTLILYERERRELGSFYRQPRGASASLLSHRRSRPAQVPRVGGGGRGEAEGPVPRGAVRGPRSGLAAPAPLGALPAPAFRVRLRGPRRAGPRRAAGGGTAAARGAAGRRAGRGRPGGMEAGREGRRQGGGRTWRRRREPGPAPGRGLPRSARREPGPLPPSSAGRAPLLAVPRAAASARCARRCRQAGGGREARELPWRAGSCGWVAFRVRIAVPACHAGLSAPR